jgi:hypothetical protein
MPADGGPQRPAHEAWSSTSAHRDWKALLADDADLVREIVRAAFSEILEAEMSEARGGRRGEHTEGRLGYRPGYYQRNLVTRVGKLQLRLLGRAGHAHGRELADAVQAGEIPGVGAAGPGVRPALAAPGHPGSTADRLFLRPSRSVAPS